MRPTLLVLVLAFGCAATRRSEAAPAPEPAPVSEADPAPAEVPWMVSVDGGGPADAAPGPLEADAGREGVPIVSTDGGDGSFDAGPFPICHGPLDCETIGCADYVPLDRVCPSLGVSNVWTARYDGDCGDYVYRFDGTQYFHTVRYWVRDTGKLVAVYAFTDDPRPCQRLSGDRSVYEQCDIAYAEVVCADADAGTD